jgi:hypothetical protein
MNGYAVASAGGGHQHAHPIAPDGSFGADPQARADYNYLSTRRTYRNTPELVALSCIAQLNDSSTH